MTKLTRKRKNNHIVKSKFRPSFKVKLKRKKTFQLVLFKLDSFTFCPLQILLRLGVHTFRRVLFPDIERSGLRKYNTNLSYIHFYMLQKYLNLESVNNFHNDTDTKRFLTVSFEVFTSKVTFVLPCTYIVHF